MMQLRASRRYIETKTENVDENDLIIFAGDFNANGPTDVKDAKSYKQSLMGKVSKRLWMIDECSLTLINT